MGLVTMGRLLDYIGTRRGYAEALSLWSLAGMAYALVSSVFGFAAARFTLGVTEAANFPAAIRRWPSGSRGRSVL